MENENQPTPNDGPSTADAIKAKASRKILEGLGADIYTPEERAKFKKNFDDIAAQIRGETTPEVGNNESQNEKPAGFENWPLERKEAFLKGEGKEDDFDISTIDTHLIEKLNSLGIKIEKTDALMNLAIYDEGEKTLRVRQDATPEYVNEFIENNILQEQDEIGPPSTEEIKEDLNFNYDEKEGDDGEGKEPTENNSPIQEPQNPEPIPTPDVVSSPAPENSPQPEKTLEEEYAELAKIRDDLAKTEALKNNFSTDTGIKVEELRAKYDDQKDRISEIVAGDIAKKYGWNSPDDVPPEKLREFKLEVNNILFAKLIEEENGAYINALKANREATWGDKAKEGLRYVLGSKAVQWYVKQNKWVRLGTTTALATAVGFGVGAFAATGAVGYAGARIVRGAASLGASAGVNKYLQREDSFLSIDALNEKERREIEVLKRKDMSLEAKSKELDKIKTTYDLKRKRIALAKGAITVGAGATGGLLAGLSEYLPDYVGGSTTSVLESKGGKVGIQDQRIPRGKFDPNAAKEDLIRIITPKATNQNLSPELDQYKVTMEKPVEAPTTASAPHPVEAVMPAPSAPAEQLFKPEVLVQEAGGKTDSVWKMLKNVLENNDRFKNLSGSGTPEEIAKQIEAKQTRVLQSLVGEVLENHEKYGVGTDGEIVVGQKVDFSELFKDSKKFNEVLNDAENLKPATIKNIVENNARIATYLKDHKGFKLTKDSVNEILNTKPKVGGGETPLSSGSEPVDAEMGVHPNDIKNQLELAESGVKDSANEDDFVLRVPKQKYSELPERDDAVAVGGGVLGAGALTAIQKVKTEDLLKEVEEAKKKLKIPDASNNPSKQSVGGLRNLRTMPEDVALQVQTNKVVDDLINNIYEKKGVLGFGRVEGLKSPEWSEMRKLPAHKVFDFYKNPEASKLPKSILESLQGSVQHRRFFEAVQSIAEKEAGGDVRPFERDDDTMEIFTKRLANFVVSHNVPNKNEEVLKKVA